MVVGRLSLVSIAISDTTQKNVCSEQEAQMCIYDASWDRSYEFCCEIDEEASKKLASMLLNCYACPNSKVVMSSFFNGNSNSKMILVAFQLITYQSILLDCGDTRVTQVRTVQV